MKQINSILFAFVALCVFSGILTAQTGNAPGKTVVRSETGIAPVIPAMFEPIATSALLDSILVRNKPMAAVLESENTQKLADGTTVTRRVTTRIYRDKDGRTRREQIFHAVGATPTPNQAAQTITIYDPVAHWGYSLNPTNSTASRHKLPANPPQNELLSNQVALLTKIYRKNPQGGTTTAYTLEAPIIQSLGKQTIAGVEADRYRVTIKVPAGAIGNTAANETIYETWISTDLKMLVKCIVSNPTSGSYSLLLTTINRSEQPRSLFEVPAGYTVSEMGIRRTDIPPPNQ